MGRHVGAHAVGHPPREDRPGAAHHDREHLRNQRHTDVGERDPDEDLERLARGSLVDEPLQQQRLGERDELARKEEDREPDRAWSLVAEVRREQTAMSMGLGGDRGHAFGPFSRFEAAGETTNNARCGAENFGNRVGRAGRYGQCP